MDRELQEIIALVMVCLVAFVGVWRWSRRIRRRDETSSGCARCVPGCGVREVDQKPSSGTLPGQAGRHGLR